MKKIKKCLRSSPISVAAMVAMFAATSIGAYAAESGAAANATPTLARTMRDGKYGFADASGKAVIPCQYDMVWAFREDLAMIRLNGKFGFLNKSGSEVVPAKYDCAGFFTEGLAMVNLGGTYDAKTNQIRGGHWGFVDKNGEVAIPIQYDWVTPFSGGVARVTQGGAKFSINKTGQREPDPAAKRETAPAATTASPKPAAADKEFICGGIRYAGFEPGAHRLFTDVGPAIWVGSDTYAGPNFRFGYYFTPNVRLALDLGVGVGLKTKEESFFEAGTFEGDYIESQMKTQKTSMIAPFSVSWEYEWHPTERISLRAGTMLGGMFVSGEKKWDVDVMVNNTYPGHSSDTENQSGLAVLFGLTAGARWELYRSKSFNIHADATASLIQTTDVKLKYKKFPDHAETVKTGLSGARVALSIGVSF